MKIVTNAPFPNRIQWVLENYTGPFTQDGPLGEFDPRRDLEVYVDGVLVPVHSFIFDAVNNRYLLYTNQSINLQGVIQVVHHMPNPPFHSGLTVLPTPTFSPVAGSYVGTQSVTILSASGTTVYYTTDGSTPTISSPVYSGVISVTASETIKALATKSGYANSAVGSAAYTITAPVAATPTFSPVAGTYPSSQSVTISTTTPGATIHYTTNGSTPTTGSPVYSAPITVSASETLKAIAVAAGYTQSSVGSAAYVIETPAATPTFSPIAGTYSSAQSVTISTTTPGATIYYTTDGSTPTTGSPVYTTAINVATTQTVKAIATASGFTQSAVGSAAYIITPPAGGFGEEFGVAFGS